MTTRSNMSINQIAGDARPRPLVRWIAVAATVLAVTITAISWRVLFPSDRTPGRGTPTSGAAVSAAEPNSGSPGTTASQRPAPVPRFAPGGEQFTKMATQAEVGENAKKVINPRLAPPGPRPGEGAETLKIRHQFIAEYETFTRKAQLTAEQEEQFRQALADAQSRRTRLANEWHEEWTTNWIKAKAAGQPAPDPYGPGRKEQEKRIQDELDDRFARILTPEQLSVLRGLTKFTMLRYSAALHVQPFDTDGLR